jgi:soluble lytic murein transglycosylase-like protein
MMHSTSENPRSYKMTASQRGGRLPQPVSPLLGVLFACIVLAFVWARIISSPAAVSAAEANPIAGSHKSLSPIFTPEIQHWRERILVWAENAALDPNLVATVMQIESCGDPLALSRAGAMGIFQVMPYHFAEGENPYDSETNARRGLGYLLKSMQAAGGNVHLALAGYNGGIGVIGWPESEWRDQTIHYADWGTGIYDDAVSGLQDSAWVQDWYQANGASLCAQAHARLGLVP